MMLSEMGKLCSNTFGNVRSVIHLLPSLSHSQFLVSKGENTAGKEKKKNRKQDGHSCK